VNASGSGIAGVDLLIGAAWGFAAMLLAVRTFRWAPIEAG
jgi:hypothetical protein